MHTKNKLFTFLILIVNLIRFAILEIRKYIIL